MKEGNHARSRSSSASQETNTLFTKEKYMDYSAISMGYTNIIGHFEMKKKCWVSWRALRWVIHRVIGKGDCQGLDKDLWSLWPEARSQRNGPVSVVSLLKKENRDYSRNWCVGLALGEGSGDIFRKQIAAYEGWSNRQQKGWFSSGTEG